MPEQSKLTLVISLRLAFDFGGFRPRFQSQH